MKNCFNIKTLIIALACLVAANVWAYDGVQNGIYFSVTDYDDGSGVATVENNGTVGTYSGQVNIPATVTYNSKTYPVVGIGYQAFKGCTGLTRVIIPEGVTMMLNEAFSGCSALTEVTLPSTMYSIYNNVFAGCTALTSVTCLREDARSCNANNFDAATYQNATLYVPIGSLSSYQSTSPWSNFANIEESPLFEENGIYYRITGTNTVRVTFKDSNLNSYSGMVSIPSTVTHKGRTYTVTAIGDNAFRACDALTGVTIPSTVTSIGYAAFYQSTALTSVTVPNSVTSLGEFCFMNCTALQSATLGSRVAGISRQCFAYCSALTSISVPSSVKTIGSFAFYGNTLLASVTLNEGLDSIYNSAFELCITLTGISFPASVRYIDDRALNGCTALAQISVNSANAYYCSSNNVLYDKQMSRLIHYAPSQQGTVFSVPNTCVEIAPYAFQGAARLQTIKIGPNVTSIGAQAFNDCQGLQQFVVPGLNTSFMADDGVLYTQANGHPQTILRYPPSRPGKHYSLATTTDTIAMSAFEGVQTLESAYIPSSVKAMASIAFAYSSVKRVVIDEGLQNIPNYAFFGCEFLESIYLPSTVTNIGEQAFYYSLHLADMTIAVNGQAPSIGDEAFYGLGYYTDSRMATVYVPSGMASQYAGLNDWLDARGNFVDINSLPSNTEFTVDSLTYKTTDDALHTTLTGVTSKEIFDPGIPPKVSYQGNLCTVDQIGSNAMQNCSIMTAVEVPFTVSIINNYAFYNCTKLKDVKLHEGLQMINQFVFSHDGQLTRLDIPATVDSISGTFVNYCNGLTGINVDGGNGHYVDIAGVLYTKDKKRLVAAPGGHGTSLTVADGTQVIGSSALRGYSNLQDIVLPKSLRVIESSAFFDNTSLATVKVPKGVTSIGNNAFGGCTSLSSAELPETLTNLDILAFNNTPQLTTLAVRATTPPTCATRINPRTHVIEMPFTDFHFGNCTLLVPQGCLAAYQAADVWKLFTNVSQVNFPVEFTRGDVNDDGDVDVSDVTAIIAHILGNTPAGFIVEAADVNYDSSVDVSDVTAVIAYILSGWWPDEIDMWYLWGYNVGDNSLASGSTAVGQSLIPLFPEGHFTNGKGVLTYTAYFNANDFFRLLHGPDNWDDAWGCNSQGQYGSGTGYGNAISIPGQDGYYTITFNTATMEFSITPYSGSTPQTFNTVALPGEHNYWSVESSEYNMSPINLFKENHEWIFRGFTVNGYNEMKFAADGQWYDNWGAQEFPYGIGLQDGYNIPVKKGTYDIYFNDITGHYHFIRQQ